MCHVCAYLIGGMVSVSLARILCDSGCLLLVLIAVLIKYVPVATVHLCKCEIFMVLLFVELRPRDILEHAAVGCNCSALLCNSMGL